MVADADLHTVKELTVILGGGLRSPSALLVVYSLVLQVLARCSLECMLHCVSCINF